MRQSGWKDEHTIKKCAPRCQTLIPVMLLGQHSFRIARQHVILKHSFSHIFEDLLNRSNQMDPVTRKIIAVPVSELVNIA